MVLSSSYIKYEWIILLKTFKSFALLLLDRWPHADLQVFCYSVTYSIVLLACTDFTFTLQSVPVTLAL